jgi:hypothetical protein
LKYILKFEYNQKALFDIERFDDLFENTGEDRIGGSSSSSGIFLHKKNQKKWIGKSVFFCLIKDKKFHIN